MLYANRENLMGVYRRRLIELARWSALRRLGLGFVVALLGLSCSSAVAAAKSHYRRGRLTVLKTTFQQHGEAAALLSNQRYAFAAPTNLNEPGVLFDDLDHQRQSVSQNGCAVTGSQIFADVLAFDCWRSQRTAPELYLIASHTRRTVPLSPRITSPCAPASPFCDINSDLVDAGSEWLEFSEANCPMGEHCSVQSIFQNLQTGKVSSDPAVQGGHELADLDSPHLAYHICSPLTIPEGFNIYAAPGPGELRFEGRFALASSPGPKGGSQTYLEECGTHLHQLIEANNAAVNPGPIAFSPHAIVWQQGEQDLNLELLPSRRRFLLRLPRPVNPTASALALTDRHLYVLDQANKLWITPLPARRPRAK